MKLIKIQRHKSNNKLYCITIFGLRIDWRRWYQVWINKGENPFNGNYEGWSDIWLSWSELQHDLWYDRVESENPNDIYDEVKRNAPKDWVYRKIPLILTIISWKSWWYKNKKLLLGILIGILLSLILK